MLTLDELLNDLAPAHREELQRASTSMPVLAVQEHPTLQSTTLCFVLHPCGTRDIMTVLLSDSIHVVSQPQQQQHATLVYLQAWWHWTACVRVG